MQTLVLASSSQWRKQLLEATGIPLDACPAGVDERALEEELGSNDPVEVAMVLARAKAEAVHARLGGFVLGADQVLWDGTEVIGKPADPEDQLARLRALRGRTHDLFTAWALVGPDGDQRVGVERTRLTLRDDLEDAELRAYVDSGEGAGCAGGYAVEGHGAWLFERIDGDWFNVVGIPVLAVLGALRELGFRYHTHVR